MVSGCARPVASMDVAQRRDNAHMGFRPGGTTVWSRTGVDCGRLVRGFTAGQPRGRHSTREEAAMRKIVNSTYITLDGVVEEPHHWPSLPGGQAPEAQTVQ